ncbi:uncharacterized protein LOC115634242 [Scaptodrosophila lebanonensis]|uniref:Uncharacterized protein LOC115619950 n=1 Tax=Drosophila lebanonensis TaxID=7225 RepID=A0A6J2UGU1_DROLE|nr:uncharacterized protein LOC115619950 [Scaptodrosophila lebanonensis]XP_030387696.1 uncharacterized protein LOC115634242 [Scaptodrosophila lebanonensis]
MLPIFRFFIVSKSTVLEYNLVLVVAGIIFMLDVYHHVNAKQKTLPNISLRSYTLGLIPWLSWMRGLSIVSYILNGLLGIWMARRPSFFKYWGYVLTSIMLLIYTFSIAVSRFFFPDFEFYCHLLIEAIWTANEMGLLEREFDCCGKAGVIDYIMTNRTPSAMSCCEVEDCHGCKKSFNDFLWNIEMEIARDNFTLFVMMLIGLVIMTIFFHSLVLFQDPYEPESSTLPSSS